jgi:peptidoglycan-associated lipoprotein
MQRAGWCSYLISFNKEIRHEKKRVILFLIILIGSLSLWGCPKKTDLAASPENGQGSTASATSASADGAASGTSGVAGAAVTRPGERAGAASEGLQPVYFDYDKSQLRTDALSLLAHNVEWLKAHPKASVRIEGNCDEHGTVEYNQALGQRRSVSAKKYLIDGGISPRRITLISYGKERPQCTENSETCWQKNRRDDFIVVNE